MNFPAALSLRGGHAGLCTSLVHVLFECPLDSAGLPGSRVPLTRQISARRLQQERRTDGLTPADVRIGRQKT